MIELDKIYNEDCLEGMKRIDDGMVDAIITDLPYGTTACAWDSVIPFEPLWEQFKRVTKPNAAIVLFGSEPFSSALRMSNIKWFKYDLIWNKDRVTNPGLAQIRPMPSFENISIFGRGRITYNPQMEAGEPYVDKRTRPVQTKNEHKYGFLAGKSVIDIVNEGTRYPKSIITFPNYNISKEHYHPTQKPIDLLRYLILTYSNTGGVILDATVGSGTTAVAALMEKRHFIGFETNKDYYQKALERINKVKQEPTLF